MAKEFPTIPWVRYADDGCLNCVSLRQAKYIIKVLDKRFKTFGLELNLTKTKIVYCKDSGRKADYENKSFDFLGYNFKPRKAMDKKGNHFISFLPAISDKAQKRIRQEIRSWRLQLNSHWMLKDIADVYNCKIRGWINYYSHFYKSEMNKVLCYINKCLIKWATRKYKNKTKSKAIKWLESIAKRVPELFAHWNIGIINVGM